MPLQPITGSISGRYPSTPDQTRPLRMRPEARARPRQGGRGRARRGPAERSPCRWRDRPSPAERSRPPPRRPGRVAEAGCRRRHVARGRSRRFAARSVKSGGPAANIGTGSPSCRAISPAQAPAALTTWPQDTVSPLSVRMAKPVAAGSTPTTFVCSIICAPDRDARRATAGDATAGSATASRFDHEAPVTTPERSGQQRRAAGPSSRSTSRPAARASRAACSSFGWSARRKAQIHVPAGNDAAVLAGEAGEILPDRMRPERQGKFRGVAPLQTQIAEVDGARGGAHPALLDHHDRAPRWRRK